MRVDFTTFGVEPPDKSKTGRAGPTGESGNGATSSTSGLDQTRFSFDQTRMQSLEAQVLAQPEIREAKVQSLQQAIGNGEYSVPASRVADAMVSELGSAGA
ncbi:MAG TPA: flagellar biosynthesis anti-sigma factor FlgM [Terriglobales bacterium]|jgi:flagellar biosynthesis anti-sigma factor FlgM|nr:flagellar biosynthesis anti-sigma factor FlgM [Terriglobales bacterium]